MILTLYFVQHVEILLSASQLPWINTERFKNCYFNRIRFNTTWLFNNIDIQCFIRFYIIIVNDLCDFHDLYTFTLCNVYYTF